MIKIHFLNFLHSSAEIKESVPLMQEQKNTFPAK